MLPGAPAPGNKDYGSTKIAPTELTNKDQQDNKSSQKIRLRDLHADTIDVQKVFSSLLEKEVHHLFFACLIVPPLTFTILCWTLCSTYRYANPVIGVVVVVLSMILVVCHWFTVSLPSAQVKRLKPLAITLTVAVFWGITIGEMIYMYQTYPVLRVAAMQERTDVDPAQLSGGGVSDTGKIHFVNSTFVDVDKGMSFRSFDTYCVAPITSTHRALSSYDYWAIGINCCSSADPNFTGCAGRTNKVGDPAGLRLMYPEQGTYFRLAIEQAEAEYGIVAGEKPLLFYWTSDPSGSLGKFSHDAFEAKLRHTFLHGAVNIILSIAVVAIYVV